MDKIWLNLSAKLAKTSANKICGSLSFKFNKISPNLVSFHAQILGLKFGEIYTQIWRRFSKFFASKKYVKFRLNYSKNLRRFFENKSANLMQNLNGFFANFHAKIWRKFINKISANLHLNLLPILNLKSKNLQFNLTKFYSSTQRKFCALGFKKFLQKINFTPKFRAKI
ncbi:MAG: hypothetical protein ACTTIV_02665 [Campylobacter sp.]